MRCKHLCGIAAIAAATILMITHATSSPVFAQQASPSATAAGKLSAQWHLNKDMSADMRDGGALAPPPGGPTGSPIGGGYPGGGNGMGRGGFGGYTGGGGATSERTLRDRAILREASQMPAVLNIVVSGTAVSMTTDDGTVRKFNASGKKEKVDLVTAEVDSISYWDKTALVQELTNGDLKLKRSWQVSEQGNQLVIAITTERTKRIEPVTVKLIYDRATH